MKKKDNAVKVKISKRALIFRLGGLVLLLAICAVMMVIGRGHTVYFDNKTFEHEGQEYKALNKITIYNKGEKVTSLAKRERGMVTCIGQTCKVSFEIVKEKGAEPEHMDVSFKLPYDLDGILINLPAYLADLPAEAYMEEFVPAPSVQEDDEEPGGEGLPGEEMDVSFKLPYDEEGVPGADMGMEGGM